MSTPVPVLRSHPPDGRSQRFLAACSAGAALFVAAIAIAEEAPSYKLTGSATLQGQFFVKDAAFPEQYDGGNLSLAIEPEFYREWAEGKQSFTFTPFARLDQHDDERTHADIRELYWRKSGPTYEWRVGVRRVFWGVTESQHLVDVINQDDFVENLDGEDKLGQPMLNLALIRDWGTLDLFLLPYFRERTFPGEEGRLRPQFVVDTDHPSYESGSEEQHIDGALRWARSFGQWDWGLSYFDGTNRDPRLMVNPGAPLVEPGPPTLVFFPDITLVPLYDQIRQVGLDLQAIYGGWAWKLEAIRRESAAEKFSAAAAGFEYTFVGLKGSAIDVGAIAEYLWDSRGKLDDDSQQGFAQRQFQNGQGFTPAEAMALQGLEPEGASAFDDDLFIGTRIAFNDVQSSDILAGVIVDRDTHAVFGSIEANRRLSDNWKLALESRFFSNLDELDPLYGLRDDDYLQLELIRYF